MEILSPFDFIYLFPYILLSCAESPDLSLALKLERIFNTSYDGWFGCDIELYPWPLFGIGTRSVWSPSNGINVHGRLINPSVFCEHFIDTLDDVVASFPFGEADSSVTAIKIGSRVVLY